MENKEIFCDKTLSLREIIEKVDPYNENRLMERVILAMLIAAATQDVAVNTMGDCLDAEQNIDFPLINIDNQKMIDTEMVYSIVETVASEILERRYPYET